MLEFSPGHHIGLRSVKLEPIIWDLGPELQGGDQHLQDVLTRSIPHALGERMLEMLVIEEQIQFILTGEFAIVSPSLLIVDIDERLETE